MPRIRTIKPEFFTDDVIVTIPFVARLVYIGLWTQADSNGVFEMKPMQLKRNLMPEQDIGTTMEKLLREDLGKFIHYYTVNGIEYGLLTTFRCHQKIDRRNEDPKYPTPENWEMDVTGRWVQNSTSDSLPLGYRSTSDSRSLDDLSTGKEGKEGKEGRNFRKEGTRPRAGGGGRARGAGEGDPPRAQISSFEVPEILDRAGRASKDDLKKMIDEYCDNPLLSGKLFEIYNEKYGPRRTHDYPKIEHGSGVGS